MSVPRCLGSHVVNSFFCKYKYQNRSGYIYPGHGVLKEGVRLLVCEVNILVNKESVGSYCIYCIWLKIFIDKLNISDKQFCHNHVWPCMYGGQGLVCQVNTKQGQPIWRSLQFTRVMITFSYESKYAMVKIVDFSLCVKNRIAARCENPHYDCPCTITNPKH